MLHGRHQKTEDQTADSGTPDRNNRKTDLCKEVQVQTPTISDTGDPHQDVSRLPEAQSTQTQTPNSSTLHAHALGVLTGMRYHLVMIVA